VFKEIRHSEITVRDLEESIAFYAKLGLKVIRKTEYKFAEGNFPGLKGSEIEIAFLQVGNDGVIELIEYKNRKGRHSKAVPWDIGQMHIAFEVTDILKIYKELGKDGIEFLSPPIYEETGEGAVLWCYLKDPNNALLELCEVKKKKRQHYE